MTKDELRNLVEASKAFAERSLVRDRAKELAPMFHLIAPEGSDKTDAVVVTPWDGDIQKQLAVLEVKKISHEMNAQACVFMTEAWVVKKDAVPNTPWHIRRAKAELRNLIPSQSPDRIECVVIFAIDAGGDHASTMLQIVRDKPGGRIVALVEDQQPGDMRYESWMFNGMFRP